MTERFSLLGPLEYGSPGRGRDLPARIRDSLRVARQSHQQRLVKGRGERIIIDKQIASAGEEFVKRDACQVRPMVRCPSVPF